MWSTITSVFLLLSMLVLSSCGDKFKGSSNQNAGQDTANQASPPAVKDPDLKNKLEKVSQMKEYRMQLTDKENQEMLKRSEGLQAEDGTIQSGIQKQDENKSNVKQSQSGKEKSGDQSRASDSSGESMQRFK